MKSSLFRAYFDARKHKRNTINALRFEADLEHNLFQLYEEIISFKYTISPSICFIVKKPVKREVFAADFRDRVVHHFLINKLMHIFENQFIYDSYSCRKGKGNLFGVKRLQHHIRSCSQNYTQPAYILKLDIQGFFMNIRKPLLNQMVKQLIEDKYFGEDKAILLYLAELIIMNDPTQNCIVKGSRRDWDGLPANKSLFKTPPDCGLPIGNLTSQIFANYYLAPFDRFMKETLKLKHYGRYVDDFFVVHSDKEFLTSLIPIVNQYLKENVGATLHPKKIYLQSCEVGVAYLGAYIKPYRTYLSKRTKGNFYRAMNIVKEWLQQKQEQQAIIYPEEIRDFVASLNSYFGMNNHYQMARMVQQFIELGIRNGRKMLMVRIYNNIIWD